MQKKRLYQQLRKFINFLTWFKWRLKAIRDREAKLLRTDNVAGIFQLQFIQENNVHKIHFVGWFLVLNFMTFDPVWVTMAASWERMLCGQTRLCNRFMQFSAACSNLIIFPLVQITSSRNTVTAQRSWAGKWEEGIILITS